MTGKLFSPCHKAGWSTQPLLWRGVVQRQSRTKPQERWLPQQGMGEREHPQIHPDGLGRAIPELHGPRGGSPDCKKGIHTLSVTSREWRGRDVTLDEDNRRQKRAPEARTGGALDSSAGLPYKASCGRFGVKTKAGYLELCSYYSTHICLSV